MRQTAGRDDRATDEAARAKLVLPFYLYEGEHFDNGSWFEPCTRGLRGEKVCLCCSSLPAACFAPLRRPN